MAVLLGVLVATANTDLLALQWSGRACRPVTRFLFLAEGPAVMSASAYSTWWLRNRSPGRLCVIGPTWSLLSPGRNAWAAWRLVRGEYPGFDEHRRGFTSPRIAALTMLFPAGYMVFALVRGAIDRWYRIRSRTSTP